MKGSGSDVDLRFRKREGWAQDVLRGEAHRPGRKGCAGPQARTSSHEMPSSFSKNGVDSDGMSGVGISLFPKNYFERQKEASGFWSMLILSCNIKCLKVVPPDELSENLFKFRCVNILTALLWFRYSPRITTTGVLARRLINSGRLQGLEFPCFN
jgi:hypothetical protein